MSDERIVQHKNNKRRHVSGLLYNEDGTLTNDHYIKDVWYYLEDSEILTDGGTHCIYAYGDIKKGDYLTTCTIEGVCMQSPEPSEAFAVAASDIKHDHLPYQSPVVGVVYAEFL